MFLFTWYAKVKHLIYHIYCSSAEIAISTETTKEKIGGEKYFEKMLWGSRFMVLSAVISSLSLSLVLFVGHISRYISFKTIYLLLLTLWTYPISDRYIIPDDISLIIPTNCMTVNLPTFFCKKQKSHSKLKVVCLRYVSRPLFFSVRLINKMSKKNSVVLNEQV